MTIPQTWHIFARLLGHLLPSPEEVARVVSRVLRRNEDTRIYLWYKATGKIPPRRPMSNRSEAAEIDP